VKFLFAGGKLGQMEINHEVSAKKTLCIWQSLLFVQLKKLLKTSKTVTNFVALKWSKNIINNNIKLEKL